MHRLAALACSLAACRSEPVPPAATARDAGASLGQIDASDPKALMELVDKMGGQLEGRPKSFEVAAALGNLYYENGRYLDAADVYRQALEMAAPLEARAQALRKRVKRPSDELPLECGRSGASYGLARISKVVESFEAKEPAKALRCADEALALAISARARRGNALYLIGNPDDALAEHRRVLDVAPDYPESLFFVGAILLEKSRHEPGLKAQGKKLWERLVAVAPDHPRAQLAKENLPKIDQLFGAPDGGVGAKQPSLPPGHPRVDTRGGAPSEKPTGPTAEQVKNVAEAAANTERTPELEKSLDEALDKGEAALDAGDYSGARSALLIAMPMRPNDPRLAAALGGAMRGLGNLLMAERVLSRALELDPRSPRANYEMGLLLAQKGDKAGASRRLQAAKADGAFARKHKVDEELAKLR